MQRVNVGECEHSAGQASRMFIIGTATPLALMALRRYEGVNRGIAHNLMPTMMAWPASRIEDGDAWTMKRNSQ
jgi:hypothetical protein